MPDRLALDTNAAVDYFRASRREPPQLAAAQEVFLPLPVLGELYAGAFGSERTEENLAAVEQAVSLWTLLIPDALTARLYGSSPHGSAPTSLRREPRELGATTSGPQRSASSISSHF